MEKRRVPDPYFGNISRLENLGKTEETKETTRKKGSLWPWLLGGALAFGGWWLYDKKKKAQALERQRQAELEAKIQAEAEEKAKPGDNHPRLKIRGQEDVSPNNRLRAIMEEE